MDILVNRFAVDDCGEGHLKQTRGLLYVFDGDEIVFQCWTLERPWMDNKRKVSCIPSGEYQYNMLNSTPSFHYTVLHVLDVPGRSGILFHRGNYRDDSSGCVLVGDGFAHINGDYFLDLTNSRKTMSEFTRTLSDLGKQQGMVKIYSSIPDLPMTL